MDSFSAENIVSKANQDASYKALFAAPQMMRDLICGFVRDPWLHTLRFETLSAVRSEYIGEQQPPQHQFVLNDMHDDLLDNADQSANLFGILLQFERATQKDQYVQLIKRLGQLLKPDQPLTPKQHRRCCLMENPGSYLVTEPNYCPMPYKPLRS